MSFQDLLYPLLAALCYSTNPILVKLGLRISDEPLLGAGIGMVTSTVAYMVYFLVTGQGRDLFTIPRWVGWYFALAGICSTLGVFSFFAALQYVPAAVVAPLTSAAPLVTLILTHLTLRGVEQVARTDVIGTVLIIFGVILLLS
jgi:uncharacterized membrane protein